MSFVSLDTNVYKSRLSDLKVQKMVLLRFLKQLIKTKSLTIH